MAEIFGVHFLEPMVRYETHMKVKPRIKPSLPAHDPNRHMLAAKTERKPSRKDFRPYIEPPKMSAFLKLQVME